MKDKTKRTWLIVLGSLACVALVIVIAGQFGSKRAADPVQEKAGSSESTPQVSIETTTPSVQIAESSASETSDPGAGADSNGTEQTIQADPVKPEAPEKPTTGADDHTDEDVPQEERNAETPPTYTKEQTTVAEPSEPEAGSTNSGGQVYVPGFGYVDNGGGNQVVEDYSIYENGNKIGSMG